MLDVPPKIRRTPHQAPARPTRTAATIVKAMQALVPTPAAVELATMKMEMTSWKRYHRQRDFRSPLQVVRVMQAQLQPVREDCAPTPGEPFPRTRKQTLVLVRQPIVVSGMRGGGSTASDKTRPPNSPVWDNFDMCVTDNETYRSPALSGEDQRVRRAGVLDQAQEDTVNHRSHSACLLVFACSNRQ